ncbi:MAG: hypothetical protein JNK23_00315 [Opitutaceae bacterium]|nr:hypothetical protein [Opitutaceae bacterium]
MNFRSAPVFPWLFAACTGTAADLPPRPMISIIAVASHGRDHYAFLRRLHLVSEPAHPSRHPPLARIIRKVADADGDTRGNLDRFDPGLPRAA